MPIFSAYHNSIDSSCRFPQGALMCNAKAALSIFINSSLDVSVRLRLWSESKEHILSPCSVDSTASGTRFTFSIIAPGTPQLIWYYFIIDSAEGRFFLGERSGCGVLSRSIPYDYPITVFSPDFTTPEWFRDGIVYQIFPDRFARSKSVSEAKKNCADKDIHPCLFHENWAEEVLFSPIDDEEFYSPCDFYGGDLMGISEKLPYLSSLGVSVVYLNPIFESVSNHRYNTSDYLSVDPVLGTEYDLAELVKNAKNYGINVILDGVFSHTGDDSVYFNKYGRYPSVGAYQSTDSAYYEWYTFRHYPDDYLCWWGFTTLPEVNELNKSYAAFIEEVLRKWDSFGIRGWRLDVADELPDEFIAFLRRTLKSMGNDRLLLGEVWEDAALKEWSRGLRQYVYGHELDSVMNYPFMNAVISFLLKRYDAFSLFSELSAQRERYPEPFYRACMNSLSTHDSIRILSVLSGAPEKDTLTREEQAKYSLTEFDYQNGRRLMVLAVTLQFSMPQPPCIYYADEVGMTGLCDPFNRRTYPWGHEDTFLLDLHRKLGDLRKNSLALTKGAAAFLAKTEDIFVVFRSFERESTVTILNRADKPADICICREDFSIGFDTEFVFFSGLYTDALSGKVFEAIDGMLSLNLLPVSSMLLVSKNNDARCERN